MRSLAIYLKNYRKESILAPFFKFLEVVFDLLVPVVIAQPLGQRIVRTAPESGLGCQRTAHHTESTLALVQLAAAYGTDRRQKKPLYIIEDRHRRES